MFVNADWPNFEGEFARTSADVDLDGLEDEVLVFARRAGDGHEGWVRAEFGNGGVATGRWDGLGFTPVPDASVHVTGLSASRGAPTSSEIIVPVGEGTSRPGAATGAWSVMTLVDCQLLTTTFTGEPFQFTSGLNAGLSTISGCTYDDDRVQLVVTERDFNGGEWDTETFELRGRRWQSVDTRNFSNFPTGDGSTYFPLGPTLSNCDGIS